MTTLGESICEIRHSLGKSIEAASVELGVSVITLVHVECGEMALSEYLANKIHSAWEVCPYMYHGAFHTEPARIPPALRGPTEALNAIWREEYRLRGLGPKGTEDAS